MPPSLGCFGHARRQAAGISLLDRLVEVGQSGVSLRALGGGRAGEVRFGRFLRCDSVTPGEMVSAAHAHTSGLVAGRHILAIQDTTSLRDDGAKNSIDLHPTIAVDAEDGALLGLVHAGVLVRDGTASEVHCNKRPFEEKESHRWLDAARASEALRTAGARGRPARGCRAGAVAIADQPHRHQWRRGAADHRLLSSALDYRTIVPNDEDQGFRHRGRSRCRWRPVRKTGHRPLIAAIEVRSLVRGRDGESGRPMTEVFAAEEQPVIEAISASLEGKTSRQKNPHAPGSLAFAAWVCARLGGWTSYYGKAGPVVMLNGLLRLRAMIEGWRLASEAFTRTAGHRTISAKQKQICELQSQGRDD